MERKIEFATEYDSSNDERTNSFIEYLIEFAKQQGILDDDLKLIETKEREETKCINHKSLEEDKASAKMILL